MGQRETMKVFPVFKAWIIYNDNKVPKTAFIFDLKRNLQIV